MNVPSFLLYNYPEVSMSSAGQASPLPPPLPPCNIKRWDWAHVCKLFMLHSAHTRRPLTALSASHFCTLFTQVERMDVLLSRRPANGTTAARTRDCPSPPTICYWYPFANISDNRTQTTNCRLPRNLLSFCLFHISGLYGPNCGQSTVAAKSRSQFRRRRQRQSPTLAHTSRYAWILFSSLLLFPWFDLSLIQSMQSGLLAEYGLCQSQVHNSWNASELFRNKE